METVQLVTFEIHGELFGIEVSKVQEVIKYDSVTVTPGAAEIIEGVIDLRGDIIPVIDLHKYFNLPIPEDYSKSCILITEVEGYIFGFIVEKVKEVTTFNLEEFSPPPPGISKPGNEYTIGVAHHEERLLLYLDIEKVIDISQFIL